MFLWGKPVWGRQSLTRASAIRVNLSRWLPPHPDWHLLILVLREGRGSQSNVPPRVEACCSGMWLRRPQLALSHRSGGRPRPQVSALQLKGTVP